MPAIIVVGAQWGDEGKGKIIDMLSASAKHVVRAQGGNNAGHTVIIGTEEYKLHLVPSGILYPHPFCYIGGGTVIDPAVLLDEIESLEKRGIQVQGRLKISGSAHVIFPFHKLWDSVSEQSKGRRAIGTTGRGIGPCYIDKTSRSGIRMAELIEPAALERRLKTVIAEKNEELKSMEGIPLLNEEEIFITYSAFGKRLAPFAADTEKDVNDALDAGENVLLEGAQGTFLDITFGTYPYVTSSNTIAGGICAGAGVGPTRIGHTIGVVKAYSTRVGNGPFPTEVNEQELFIDHLQAREVGTTTGRTRRIGWFDAVLARQAVRLNGIDSIALTKLDILDRLDEIKLCTGYQKQGRLLDHFPVKAEDYEGLQPVYEIHPGWRQPVGNIKSIEQLPTNAQKYLRRIESLCRAPISMLSVGPERERTIVLRDFF